jgi:1-acyl-sn-glycerol-3-phosphate acyltransferase
VGRPEEASGFTDSPALPGAGPPRRRLPVNPAAQALRTRLRTWRPPSAFPLAAPTWPGTVPRPPVKRNLGMDYDSEWARRYPARFGRVLVSELVARPVVRLLATPQVDGLDRIAHLDEPVIFAANHASHLDAPLLLSVIPERWRHHMFVAGAADYFFDSRLKAVSFAFLINAVPIERQRVSRESANRVAALLGDGWSLLIFPEGGRSPDGWGQPHRAGAAWLGVRTGRPIVPVHLEGTRQILAKGSTRLRPGVTYVTFGHPLRSREGTDPRLLAAELETAVAALADERTTNWWVARKRAAQRTTPSLTGPPAGAWRRTWALGERASVARRKQRRATNGWPRP